MTTQPPRRPAYPNEEYHPNPEKLWKAIRKGLREYRHRKVVEELPPPSTLAELRRSCHVSQTGLAVRLGTDQTRLSRRERHPDPRYGWLSDYVAALGGALHLLARFPRRDVRIVLSAPPPRDSRGGSSAIAAAPAPGPARLRSPGRPPPPEPH
jgi:hypothetical protein